MANEAPKRRHLPLVALRSAPNHRRRVSAACNDFLGHLCPAQVSIKLSPQVQPFRHFQVGPRVGGTRCDLHAPVATCKSYVQSVSRSVCRSVVRSTGCTNRAGAFAQIESANFQYCARPAGQTTMHLLRRPAANAWLAVSLATSAQGAQVFAHAHY